MEDDNDEDWEWEWEDYQAQLCPAAEEGETEHVRELLDEGMYVDVRDWDKRSALMLASGEGHVEVVELLLSRQAKVNAQSTYGDTALILAAQNGHVVTAKVLVAAGADIHRKADNGNDALMCAALNDQLPVCLFLLSKGADLTAVSYENRSALTHYGRWAGTTLSPEILAERRTALEEAWRAGPHPSQVQRRKDEAWDRRKSLMQVSAENGYRPLLHRQLAEKAAIVSLDPAAAIPGIEIDTPAKRHAHLLGQVLSNEGIHHLIVSFL